MGVRRKERQRKINERRSGEVKREVREKMKEEVNERRGDRMDAVVLYYFR